MIAEPIAFDQRLETVQRFRLGRKNTPGVVRGLAGAGEDAAEQAGKADGAKSGQASVFDGDFIRENTTPEGVWAGDLMTQLQGVEKIILT